MHTSFCKLFIRNNLIFSYQIAGLHGICNKLILNMYVAKRIPHTELKPQVKNNEISISVVVDVHRACV